MRSLQPMGMGISMLRIAVLASAALLAACASSSDDIAAQYVSPMQYQSYDCGQIAAEQQRVAARVAQLKGEVDDNATGDVVKTGVGLVLFWPALFFIDGDGPEANEYARLKGEHEALQKAEIEKKCTVATTDSSTALTPPATP